MKTTPEQIKMLARKATFFKNGQGDMLRIEFSDEEDTFHCVDEDTLYEFDIAYADVELPLEAFYALVEITVENN